MKKYTTGPNLIIGAAIMMILIAYSLTLEWSSPQHSSEVPEIGSFKLPINDDLEIEIGDTIKIPDSVPVYVVNVFPHLGGVVVRPDSNVMNEVFLSVDDLTKLNAKW